MRICPPHSISSPLTHPCLPFLQLLSCSRHFPEIVVCSAIAMPHKLLQGSANSSPYPLSGIIAILPHHLLVCPKVNISERCSGSCSFNREGRRLRVRGRCSWRCCDSLRRGSVHRKAPALAAYQPSVATSGRIGQREEQGIHIATSSMQNGFA